MALAAPAALPETRRRLEALVPAGEVDGLVARAGADLLAMRTVSAGKLLSGKAAADFYLVQAGKQSAAEARFIRGDDRLRPFTKAVQDLTPAVSFRKLCLQR